MAAGTSSLRADTGDLDPGFGVNGIAFTSALMPARLQALVAQPDGRLVVGGGVGGSPVDFALARYLADGTLDPSFDGDGLVRTAVGTSAPLAALALQSDGKILAAGGGGEIVVVRYATDGSLDTGFDGDGIVHTVVGGNARASAVAVQPDGRIVVVGTAGPSFAPTFAVVRYEADGSLDPTFDGDGIVTTAIELRSYGFALALQPDGKIVAAGVAISAAQPAGVAVVARYDFDGSLDATFDGDGIVTSALSGWDGAMAVAVQPDGKIVTVGLAYGTDSVEIAVVRYDDDGGLDTTFDGDGVATIPLGGGATATALVVQPDGKLLVAGGLQDIGSGGSVVLARFDADGGVDHEFYCGNGAVVTPMGTESYGLALVLQPDGKPVVAGGGYDATAAPYGVILRFGGTPTTVARAAVPTKLIVVNSLASTGTAKAVYVSRDDPVWKGSATDIDKIRVRLDLAYHDGAATGAFEVGCGSAAGWVVNKDYAAKYVNRLAPGGPSQAKVVVIKSGIVARFVGRGTGEEPFDILAAGPPAGSVFANLEVTNDTERNRHCSEFPACVWTSIAAGTGAKLVCRGGTFDVDCRAAP